jgi:HEAT repeat protein
LRFFRRSQAEQLMKAGDVAGLIAPLHSGSKGDRADAANALASHPEAEEALIAALSDSEGVVQSQAIFALGEIGSRKAFSQIANFLHHNDSMLRTFAVNALTWIATSGPSNSSGRSPTTRTTLYATR